MISATEYFYELTPEVIHDAFGEAGLELQPTLRWLNSLENRVVGVEDLEGERWVGKFYRPGRWSRKALEEEHAFMRELFEADLPVRPPVPLENGKSVGETKGIFFTIFPHHFGRMPDEIDFEQAHTLGSLVARIHRQGQRREHRHRRRVGPTDWGLKNLEALEKEEVVPPGIWRTYNGLVRELCDLVRDLFEGFEEMRLHGDLHRGNILCGSHGISFVDFDDTTMGPAIQDLWMLLPGRDNEAIALRETFLESYESIRPFERDELALIEPLRALKFVRHAAWVARRRKDPAFQRLYPDVETHSYWRRELEDLEAQLRLLQQ